MRRAFAKVLVAAALIASLVLAIGHTGNESPWLGVWFLFFFFLGLPLALLSVRDLLASFAQSGGEPFRSWLLLHVCAVFAAGIGFLLAHMARLSGHPKAELHQWLVLLLPVLVYLAPILLGLHVGSFGFLKSLCEVFKGRSRDE